MEKRSLRRLLAAVTVILFPALAEARQCLMTKVTADRAVEEDQFGSSLALVGDTLFVGAPYENGPGIGGNSGAVYVLQRDGLNWFQQQKLAAPDAQRGHLFGEYLDSDGQTLAVMAWRYLGDEPGDPGQLYVYERGASGWELVFEYQAQGPRLVPDTLSSLAEVEVSGDWIFVGTTNFDGSAVHTFHRGSAGWAPAAKILPSDPRTQTFGWVMEAQGDTLAIGAPNDEGLTGSVFLFERSGDSWTEVGKLRASSAVGLAQFGMDLALDRDTLVVGAPGDSQWARGSGAVFVFERGASGWVQSAKLAPPDLPFAENLGRVGLSGELLLAVGRARNGEGYAFERIGGIWQERARVPIPRRIRDIDVSGGLAAVANPFDFQRRRGAGAVSVYSLGGTACASLRTPHAVSWGKERLEIDRGPEHAGHSYWLVGSTRGTLRGLAYRGTRIPLNLDPYFIALVRQPNMGLFSNNLGVLDGNGRASLVLAVPLEAYASFVGLALDHAFVEFGPEGFEHVSNAVTFQFRERR